MADLDAAARRQFHPVRVIDRIEETDDAVSLVVEPEDPSAPLDYRPGQFVTLRAWIGGVAHLRSYSMSSTPGLDPDLRITVKRVPDGLVSNWVADHVAVGDRLEVQPPAGGFVRDDDVDELVMFAAGSGITPIHSIVRDVVATDTGRVRLLYANRDRASSIFADELDELAARHPERLIIHHHLDVDAGLLSAETVRSFVADEKLGPDVHWFICGPNGFMDVVESTLRDDGVPGDRVHLERFTPADESSSDDAGGNVDCEVTVTLGSRTVTTTHRAGTTLLQTARAAGLRAPSSCQTGSCATCMARLISGDVVMRHNEALTADEVADGWILTCQSEPVTDTIDVVYE